MFAPTSSGALGKLQLLAGRQCFCCFAILYDKSNTAHTFSNQHDFSLGFSLAAVINVQWKDKCKTRLHCGGIMTQEQHTDNEQLYIILPICTVLVQHGCKIADTAVAEQLTTSLTLYR